MPPHPHCHWRGVKEWRDLGLPMSTVSDEACKLYDAALTQVLNHYDDATAGGMDACMKKAVEADPDFVMGHALMLQLSGKKVRNDPAFAQEVYKLAQLAQKQHVSSWERQHATAVKLLSEGFAERATVIYEDILVEHPYDMFALRSAYELHLVSGNSMGLRDSCGRILPQWKKDTPLYGDLLGMYGFGLEETNLFSEAEKAARQAIEINPYDAWANHCVAHCMEMTGQDKEGIKFMTETENNWNYTMLMCHNYWHWALFLVECGEFESAIGILDEHIIPFLKKSRTAFSHSDAASLCFRLEAEGYSVGDRWQTCYELTKEHAEEFPWAFYDLHNVMTLTAMHKQEEANRLIQAIRKFVQQDANDYKPVYRDVVLPMSEAFQAWDDKNYDQAVEFMKPLRYKIYQVGGSNAQRDIFNIFAIHAAMRSSKPENKKYAKHLLLERRCLRGDTPLISRLMQQASATGED